MLYYDFLKKRRIINLRKFDKRNDEATTASFKAFSLFRLMIATLFAACCAYPFPPSSSFSLVSPRISLVSPLSPSFLFLSSLPSSLRLLLLLFFLLLHRMNLRLHQSTWCCSTSSKTMHPSKEP